VTSVKSAIGIDREPKAILRANQLARNQDFKTLQFIQADMMSLPFDDSEFDAVFFHAALYHLDAAALTRTLAEARRVLATDGLVGIRDSEVGGNVLYPESVDLLLSLDLWTRWYEHADADAIRFGRRQGSVLRAHGGFTPIWSGASFVNHSADAAVRRETVADAKRSLEGLRHDLIARGLAKYSEVEQALAAWDEWGSNPDAVYLRCRCEYVARKARP
jgi:SAM-dependent methyltransferase